MRSAALAQRRWTQLGITAAAAVAARARRRAGQEQRSDEGAGGRVRGHRAPAGEVDVLVRAAIAGGRDAEQRGVEARRRAPPRSRPCAASRAGSRDLLARPLRDRPCSPPSGTRSRRTRPSAPTPVLSCWNLKKKWSRRGRRDELGRVPDLDLVLLLHGHAVVLQRDRAHVGHGDDALPAGHAGDVASARRCAPPCASYCVLTTPPLPSSASSRACESITT